MDSAEADVLAIFDCCYASNASKGYAEDHRVYELIAASPKDSTTPAPGENSFTSRLIASLRELLEEHNGGCFTTSKLVATINRKHKKSPKGRPAMLHDRLETYHNRHIKLSRVDNEAAELKQEILDQQPVEVAHLDLRFSLQKPDLDQEQIEILAPELRSAFEKAKIPLCRIDWSKFVPNRTHTLPDNVRASVNARRWRKGYIMVRATLNSPVTISSVTIPPTLEHTTSRDIVESPVTFLDESESDNVINELQPLMNPDRSPRRDKPVRRLLRYLHRTCTDILACMRRMFRKDSAFCSMV